MSVAARGRELCKRVREILTAGPTSEHTRPTAQGGGPAGEVSRLQGRFICSALLSDRFPRPYHTVVPGLLPARFLGEALPPGVSVLGSIEEPAGGSLFFHVSLARRDRLPSYEELHAVRRVMFRRNSTVLQVFPPEEEHVNIHPHCLHLWECLDGWEGPPDLRQHDPLLGGLGI